MSKENIVLVHGFLSGAAYWHKQIKALESHYNVLAITHAGFAERYLEQSPTSIEGFADDVVSQASKAGFDQFHLMGHSMGGMIVQALTASYPRRVKKLILYGTGPNGKLPGRFESLQESINLHKPDNYVQYMHNAVYSWFYQTVNSNPYQQTDINDAIQLAEQVSYENYLNGLKCMDAWDGERKLKDITQPTLILWGDKDRTYHWDVQPKILWRQIVNSSLAVIPNVAHNAHLDAPEIFNALLLRFLQTDITS